MATRTPTIPAPAERRIRREARSATLRELAVGLRHRGRTLADIGLVLGVSPTRVLQILRKAKRLASENETGAPARERPLSFDSNDPSQAGRQQHGCPDAYRKT